MTGILILTGYIDGCQVKTPQCPFLLCQDVAHGDHVVTSESHTSAVVGGGDSSVNKGMEVCGASVEEVLLHHIYRRCAVCVCV